MNRYFLALIFVVSSQSYAVQSNSVQTQEIDIQLMGADLIDELVYSWKKSPPFESTTGVALAELIAPVGLDERFQVLVENRLYELLRDNANVPLYLVHCSLCLQQVVKSDPEKTVISRGIHQPEVVSGLLKTNPKTHALSLMFEAQGRELVLRAMIFKLSGDQQVMWAKTYTTSLASRRVLQEGAPLVSLEAARKKQADLLNKREPMEFVTRFSLRMFGSKDSSVDLQPLIFIEQSFTGIPSVDRKTRIALTLGFTSIREYMSGWSIGGHVARLLFRKRPSLSDPDLYWFVGFHQVRMRGEGAIPFGQRQFGSVPKDESEEPRATIISWRTGFETFIKHRFGAFTFIEYVPLLKKSVNIEEKKLAGIPYHNYGLGMAMRW